MKAVYFTEHGDIDKLEFGDMKLPVPQSHETLVKVRAVALNHLDIWVRRGWSGLQVPLPHIGGSDICGDVVTSSDRENWRPGTRVVVYPGFTTEEDEYTQRGEYCLSPSYKIIGEHCNGGLADYVTVPTTCLRTIPSQLPDDIVAALPLAGTTAWRMLQHRTPWASVRSVLVVGSGGGVNSLATLIAAQQDKQVICLAGSPEKALRAKNLGASATILYKSEEEWHKSVLRLTEGKGVDVVVDNVGEATFPQSLKCLRPGGTLVTVGNTSGALCSLDNRRIFAKQLSIVGSTMGNPQDFDDALKFLSERPLTLLRHLVDVLAPLGQAKAQLARMESGEHSGKIVLSPLSS